MMPQATEQYVQVLRVSVGAGELEGTNCRGVSGFDASEPERPTVVPATPAPTPS